MFGWIKSLFCDGFPWATLGLVAAISGGVLYGIHLIKAEVTLNDQILALEQQQVNDIAAIDEVRIQAARDMAAVVAEKEQETKRAAYIAQQLEEIQNAPKADDGSVSPVLRHALAGLHRAARTQH